LSHQGKGESEVLSRLELLARAGELLSSSLDYEQTLTQLADLVVPELAGWCAIDVVGADGELERLTVAHPDPAKRRWAQELQELYPPDPESPTGPIAVARTGEPELVSEISDELLVAATGDGEERLRILRELGLTSYMCVPLNARGETIGVLTLVADDPARRYDASDLEFAAELARRAAAAVDNARLFTELKQSEERYRLLFKQSPMPMWVYDAETLAFLAVNEAAVRHYGYSRDEFLAMTIAEIRPREEVEALLADLEQGIGSPVPGTWRHRKKDGTTIDVEITAGRVVFAGRDAALVLVNDVTERQHLEDQLAQAHKMEALGRLAGGVAHDFNNLLTVVSGYASILLAREPEASAELKEIARAAELATELTRQLLAFSRRQVLQPRVLDLNDVVSKIEPMLRRVVGEHIDVSIRLAPSLPEVEADPGQLEVAILNLAANARDAMPSGGTLTLETASVELDEEYMTTHLEGTPGQNAMLAITDTGVGMSEEVRAHLFEPFFTTKEVGSGTGLGLASVFGAVRQSGGSIYVYSEPGAGTALKIYLPAVSRAEAPAPPDVAPAHASGSATILVVEDNEAVRALVATMLTDVGHRVLAAANADEAEQAAREHAGPIDVLLTDLIMPGLGGPELAERLLAEQAELRVVFMSGYADEAVVRRGVISPGTLFLEKPFTRDMLIAKVGEALAASAST
jgi:PAS domain S-box-containing protein